MAIDPFTASLVLQGAGGLISGLSGTPGGDVRREGVRRLRSLSGRPVFDVGRAIARNRAAQIPRISRLGESVNRRFGFDTGRGQQALLTNLLEGERRFNLGADIESQRATSRRDLDIALGLSRFRG
jgi:hypothetical protein